MCRGMSHFEMPVELYMTSPVVTMSETSALSDVDTQMLEGRVSSIALLDAQGKLSGILSRTDLLSIGQVQAGNRRDAALLALPNKTARDVMTRDVMSVTTTSPMSQAAKLMREHHIHRVFVLDGTGQLVGVLSTYDLVRAIGDKRVNKPVAEIMSTPVFTVRAEEPVHLATERLEKARVSGLVVVEDDWPVGVFTQEEALLAQGLERSASVEGAMSPAMLCLDVSTPIHRAAQQVWAMQVRRVIAVEDRDMKGIITGLDFARVVAG